MTGRYEIVFTRAARHALETELPESVAVAASAFIAGDLRTDPRRVGKVLRPPLEGVLSARRGSYRIRYRIDDERVVITIVSVARRRDAYRR